MIYPKNCLKMIYPKKHDQGSNPNNTKLASLPAHLRGSK
jgi:hypothetical protein